MNKYAGDHSFDPYLADQQQFQNGKYCPYMSLRAYDEPQKKRC